MRPTLADCKVETEVDQGVGFSQPKDERHGCSNAVLQISQTNPSCSKSGGIPSHQTGLDGVKCHRIKDLVKSVMSVRLEEDCNHGCAYRPELPLPVLRLLRRKKHRPDVIIMSNAVEMVKPRVKSQR